MTEQEYRAHPALNASYLKNVLAHSVKYADWCNREFQPTPAMQLGTAVHSRVLPNQGFFEQYALCDLPRNTKAGKDLAASIEEEGKIALTGAQWNTIDGIAQSIAGNPEIAEFMYQGQCLTEHPILFTHPETQHGMKSLLDHVNLDKAALIDLKTTSNLIGYAKDFWARYVDLQIAQYRMAALCEGIEIRECYILAVETSPPYEAQMFLIEPDAIAIGEIRLREALDKYDRAQQTGETGLDTFNRIEAPAWLAAKYAAEESPFN